MGKNALFVTLVARVKRFEAYMYLGQFLPIPMDSFTLQVAQLPRSPKLAIFVLTMTTTDIQTALCMRAG